MKRKEFKDRAKKTIDDIASKIDALETKNEAIAKEAKEQYSKEIKLLKTKKKELQEHFDKLEDAGEEKLDEIMGAFDKSMQSFKEGFDNFLKIFK